MEDEKIKITCIRSTLFQEATVKERGAKEKVFPEVLLVCFFL
jgi:hypothetical protein